MLVVTALGAIATVGLLGTSIDIGKMLVVKSELQSYTDAASIAAALQLDGSTTGITDATNAARSTGNTWNLNRSAVPTPTVKFATAAAGPYIEAPATPANYAYVRVQATATVNLLFLPIIVRQATTPVTAYSIAAQVQKITFKEGLFPFSPFAHSTVGPDFGLVPGETYTLRWPSNPTLGSGNNGNNSNMCPGDRTQAILNLANAQAGSERGYIEDTSAALIARTIIDDYQSITRTIGDYVDMTGGAKQSQLASLNTRINQDTDVNANTYSAYRGNGRRLVLVPINDGGTPPGSNYKLVQFGLFFLLRTGQYGNGGNQAWCAEYVGSGVEGSHKRGVLPTGAYVVRLVE